MPTKKPVVLWVGNDQKHCRALMKLYADRIRSYYADRIGSALSEERALSAILLIPGREEAPDAALCREVCSFASEKWVPVFLIGQKRQLYEIFSICPDAPVRLIREERLMEALSHGRLPTPRIPVIVFSDATEYFAYCEEKAESALPPELRMLYCKPNGKYGQRLAVKPALLLFGEDVLQSGFAENLLKQNPAFSAVPYLILYSSDHPPGAVRPDFKPFAAIDVRDRNADLIECIHAAIREKNQPKKKKRVTL